MLANLAARRLTDPTWTRKFESPCLGPCNLGVTFPPPSPPQISCRRSLLLVESTERITFFHLAEFPSTPSTYYYFTCVRKKKKILEKLITGKIRSINIFDRFSNDWERLFFLDRDVVWKVRIRIDVTNVVTKKRKRDIWQTRQVCYAGNGKRGRNDSRFHYHRVRSTIEHDTSAGH